jgi:transcription elongation factor Elf1
MNGIIEKTIYCPYCGESIEVLIEAADHDQEYIEDCQVCCRPITFNVNSAMEGDLTISVRTEDDSY